MAQVFRLPDIGEGLTEAEVVRWLVEVGGTVAIDQPVVEVETDKAVVEIPSPHAGTLLYQGASAGEILAVGAVLLVVGEPGETWLPEGGEAAPIVGTISEEAEDLTQSAFASTAETKTARALPLVRKMARDLGVDIESLAGTGPGGTVTREDVLAATGAAPKPAPAEPPAPAAEAPAAEAPAPAVSQPRTAAAAGEGTRRRMSKLRRTIADNMSRSWAEIPHVTTFDRFDGTRLFAARRALEKRHGAAVPLDALIVKAVIPALRAFPEFNSSIDGEDLVLHERQDVGVAVDTDEGLMVVVVRDAGSMGLLEVGAEILSLAERARSRSLPPDRLSGQTFTISNIGAVGGGYGTPLVPHGTAAILSVGRGVEEPVARDGRVTVAPVVPVSLSYDHRIIDGALGRRFAAMLIENLSEPALFLAG